MKITLTRDTAIGGEHFQAGKTVTVGDAEGVELINMGKAQPSGGKRKVKDRSVGLDTKKAGGLVKRSRKK